MSNLDKCKGLLEGFTEEQLAHVAEMLTSLIVPVADEQTDSADGIMQLCNQLKHNELAVAYRILQAYDAIVDDAFCEDMLKRAKASPDFGKGSPIEEVASRLGVDL